MKKGIFFFLAIILLISFTSAASIGSSQKNQVAELYQTCNNCTYCNLTSIKYPNYTNILTDVEMIKRGTEYNYTLISNYTSVIGTYKYCYDCGNAVEKETGCIDFEITPTGKQLTTQNSIVLFGSFLVLIILTIFFLIGGISIKKPSFKIFVLGLAVILMVTTLGFSVTVFQQMFGEIGTIVSTYGKVFILMTILLTAAGIGLIVYLTYVGIKSFYNNARGKYYEDDDEDY